MVQVWLNVFNAELSPEKFAEFRSCVRVEVDVLGCPS